MMMQRTTFAFFALASLTSALVGDWSEFRGPGGRAVADDTPIPTPFGPEQNVLWKVDVPDGHSSPCIIEDHVFVTGFEDGRNIVLAIDRSSGKELWRRSFEGPPPPEYAHPDAAPALPTPVSDGEFVGVYFGDYGLLTLDLDGELVWEKRMRRPRGSVFGIGSSPLLIDGLLILSRDGAEEAGILAFDLVEGTEIWRIDRFAFGEAHGTPFRWRNTEREELVVVGTSRLCSYDPASGEPLWVVEGLTNLPCTTPTANEQTLYFAGWSTPNATGRSFWDAGFARSLELSNDEIEDPARLFARLDANDDGKVVADEVPECRAKDAFGFLDRNASGAWEVDELVNAESPGATSGRNLMVAVPAGVQGKVSPESLRWTWTRGLPYVSSPLLYRGRLWLFKAGGIATCLDAATGSPIINRARLEDRSEYYMSPVGAAGHVIIGSAEGTLYVLDAEADELTVQHTANFDEGLFATPAVLNGKIYLRSTSTLWAFGDP